MRIIRDIRTVRTLLTEAEVQALDLGDSTPGAEHLVLAALMLDDDSGRLRLGVDADRFRAALEQTHAAALDAAGIAVGSGTATPAPPPRGVYRSEVSAREVLQRARVLAKGDRPRGLRAVHVIRAAAEREYGTVARVLTTLGIDRETVL